MLVRAPIFRYRCRYSTKHDCERLPVWSRRAGECFFFLLEGKSILVTKYVVLT